MDVLGVPVCHPAGSEHASAAWTKRLGKVRETADALSRLPQGHLQYLILRYCLDSCKVNDLLRALPTTAATPQREEMARMMRDTLSGIVGLPLTIDQWAHATVPIRQG
jgi:hypothetical protein